MEESTLTKTARSFKSEFVIFLLVFLSISLFAYLVYTFKKGSQPKPQNVPYVESVYPGQTSKNEVEKILGKPTESETEGSLIYKYPTASKFRQISIEFTNDTVSIVKQQMTGDEQIKLPDYISKYGSEEAILYNRQFEFSPGYFWGTKGLLVFASKFDGGINEIWYFAPISKEEFLEKFSDFSEEDAVHFEQFNQP